MALDRPDGQDMTITTAKNIKTTKISVTDTSTTHALQDETLAVRIISRGPNTAYYDYAAAATTNDEPIYPKSYVSDDVDEDEVSFICDSGNTATVHVREYG